MSFLGNRRIVTLAAVIITVLWLIGVAWYVFDYVGSDSLAGLLPHEMGTFIAGVVTPILLLWLLVAFMARGQALKEHTDALAARLAELTFPDQASEHRIHSIAEAKAYLARHGVPVRHAPQELAMAAAGGAR